MHRLQGQSAIQPLGAILILALAYQLIQAKRSNAELNREIVESVQPFVLGSSLPAVTLKEPGGRSTTLSRVCAEGAPVVIVFWSNNCKACLSLKKRISELASGRKDLKIVLVGADGLMPTKDIDIRSGIRVTADPHELSVVQNIKKVPTVLTSDNRCRASASAIGVISAGSLLKMLMSNGSD